VYLRGPAPAGADRATGAISSPWPPTALERRSRQPLGSADQPAAGRGVPDPGRSRLRQAGTGKRLGQNPHRAVRRWGRRHHQPTTIKRADLYQVLHQQASSRGVRLVGGNGKRPDRCRAGPNDGGAGGCFRRTAPRPAGDVLIGCDGVHSTFRPIIDPSGRRPRPTPGPAQIPAAYARGVQCGHRARKLRDDLRAKKAAEFFRPTPNSPTAGRCGGFAQPARPRRARPPVRPRPPGGDQMGGPGCWSCSPIDAGPPPPALNSRAHPRRITANEPHPHHRAPLPTWHHGRNDCHRGTPRHAPSHHLRGRGASLFHRGRG